MSRVVQNLILLWGICLMLILGLVVDQGWEFRFQMEPGFISLVLMLAFVWGARRWLDKGENLLVPRFWLTAFAVYTASVLAITIFQQIAFSYRYAAPESLRIERSGADRANFVDNARLAIYLICTGIVVITIAVSIWIGRQNHHIRWRTSTAFAIITLIMYLVALQAVEHVNACYVGEPLLIPANCR